MKNQYKAVSTVTSLVKGKNDCVCFHCSILLAKILMHHINVVEGVFNQFTLQKSSL